MSTMCNMISSPCVGIHNNVSGVTVHSSDNQHFLTVYRRIKNPNSFIVLICPVQLLIDPVPAKAICGEKKTSVYPALPINPDIWQILQLSTTLRTMCINAGFLESLKCICLSLQGSQLRCKHLQGLPKPLASCTCPLPLNQARCTLPYWMSDQNM